MFDARKAQITFRRLAVGASLTLVVLSAAALPARAQDGTQAMTASTQAAIVQGFDLSQAGGRDTLEARLRAAAIFACQNPATGFSGNLRSYHACYRQARAAALAQVHDGLLMADLGMGAPDGRK
jgi:UrcA family protein